MVCILLPYPIDFTASHWGKPVFFKEEGSKRKFIKVDYESENLKGVEWKADVLGNLLIISEFIKKNRDRKYIFGRKL